MGNAKALKSGTGDRYRFPRFFYLCPRLSFHENLSVSGNLQGRNSKNIMKIKSFLTAFAVCAGLFMFSCKDYDDTMLREQLENHEQRLASLEEWQKQTNSNISAIQQLLSTQDYITKVTPITINGENTGYTVEFAKSDPISIYNGAKGDNGDTPQIGIAKEGDNWYWTLDGEPIKDEDDNIVYAKGDEGNPAPTPQICLGSSISGGTIATDNGSKDENAWYLSVDNGTSWYRISGDKGDTGATGDAGQKGEQGDAWFAKAPELSDDGIYYIFTLADGDDDDNNNPTFKIPVYQSLKIGDGEGILLLPNNVTEIQLDIPEGEYTALIAQVTPQGTDGTYTDISTRSADAGGWSVKTDLENKKVSVTTSGGTALLRITLIQSDESELTASRILYFQGYVFDEESSTYNVYGAEGLQAWVEAAKTNSAINCTLEADINLSELAESLGTINNFNAILDGKGHSITGFRQNSGLFETINGNGMVKDLYFKNPQIIGDERMRIIAYTNDGIISNCHVENGIVQGTNSLIGYPTGGLVNVNRNLIMACSFEGYVTGPSNSTGGITGSNNSGGTVISCYTSGTVEGKSYYAGGIAGSNRGNITACYSTAEVSAVAGNRFTPNPGQGVIIGHFTGGEKSENYWSGDETDHGIGTVNYGDSSNENTIRVDGSTVTWQSATSAMNTAIQTWNTSNDNLCTYVYEQSNGDNNPPTLASE